jgi:MarR family transcriptional regulator, organic hydroperoxide resistance regulator
MLTYYGWMTRTGPPQDPALGYALAEGIYSVYAALQGSVGDVLRQEELSEALTDGILALDPAAGPRSRRALAELLHCDPSNVTLIVDRLAARGLVESRPDTRDRRMKMIALTPAGKAMRDRLMAMLANHPVFARLTAEEQRQLAALLARCTEQPVTDKAVPSRPTTASSERD